MATSPQVSVTAIANGSEANGSPAIFRFSRTGSTTDPLSVIYRLLGTAQAGSDYSGASTGTISFSAGSATAELSLAALADSVVDPGETIIAQIVPSTTATPSYLITPGQQTATATITAEGMVVTVKGTSWPRWSKGEHGNPIAFAALKSDGTVVCWGEAGNGGTTPAGLGGVTQIFSNTYAFAALKSDGTVVAWGDAAGTTPAGLGGVTQIFSNGYAFAALKSDGTVVSWGMSYYNERGVYTPITTPAGLGGVTQIFSTNSAFAALKSDGTVVCWGPDWAGGTTPAGLSGVTQIFSNSYAFAALKSDGTVVGWGFPSCGGTTNYGITGTAPVGLGGVTQIFSTDCAFAALKSDGTVVSWGSSYLDFFRGVYTPITTPPAGLGGVTQIFSTGNAFAALKSDGTVLSWGSYWDTEKGTFTQITTPAGLGGVTQIFSTGSAFAALKSDGTVVSWGNSWHGGTTPAGLGGVTQIFSNGSAFAALKSDGTVVCWGNPSWGGTTPAGLGGVTQIFSNGSAFAALKSDGTVVCWGNPSWGGTTPAGLSGVVGFANPHTDDRLVSPTVDTSAPTAPTLALASDSGSSNTDRLTNNPSITVAGLEAGATWQYSTNGGANWSASLSASTTSFSVAPGSYSTGQVQVRQSDAAGNSSPANNTFQAFTVDTTAPTAPTLALASDTGSSSSDRLTNNASITVVGLEAGAVWQYSTNSGISWSTALSATTTTSFSVAAGSYSTGQVLVRQTDAAGNSSPALTTFRAFTVDTTAPTTTAAITAVADNVGLIKGNVAAGTFTDDSTPTISGTISAALASGETLRLFNGTTLLGTASVNNTAKTWLFTPTALAATAGTAYSITARVADAAGNLTAPSASFSFSLDTTAPTTTAAITAISDDVGLLQGNLAASAFTDDTTPTFTGTISAALASGETLRLFNGTTLLGSASVNNTAQTWSFTPTALAVTAGTAYSITARVADAAGNLTAPSASFSFSLDTTAPTTTAAITAISDDVGLLQGNLDLAARAFTDDTTPSFSGTISAALVSGETLRIFNGTTLLGSASVSGTTWSFTPAALPNGFYAVTARVADAAGNLGAVSAARRFSLDATANQVIGDANANSLNATSAKDLLTGLAGADTFSFATLTASTLSNFDRITDFAIGPDRLDGPTAVTAANINKLGAVSALDVASIGNLLSSTSFLANQAATFTYADPSGISRSFIALNDGIAGYSSGNDAIVEITGYTGLLANLAVI